MDTTTPDGGAQVAEPITPTEAVTTGQNQDQVIVTDADGTPTMAPVTSTNDQPSETPAVDEAASQDAPATDTQATNKTDAEILDWAEKKGLTINPENPNEVKLARMQLETDRKFHENQQRTVLPPEEIPLTGTDAMDTIVSRQNEQELKTYVRDWFDANSEMKAHRAELTQIANDRPWLQNLDDVKAHYLAQPGRTEELKREGGREALTNLAQKQQAVPPSASATNSGNYESAQITPQNVDAMVASHDQAWFEKNHRAISKAMEV